MRYDFGDMLTVGTIHFEDTVWFIIFARDCFCVFHKSRAIHEKLRKSASVSLRNIAQANQEIKVLCKHRQTKQTMAQDQERKQSSLMNGMGVSLLYPAVPDYPFS